MHVLCEPEQHTTPPSRDRKKRTVSILMSLYSPTQEATNLLKMCVFVELVRTHGQCRASVGCITGHTSMHSTECVVVVLRSSE